MGLSSVPCVSLTCATTLIVACRPCCPRSVGRFSARAASTRSWPTGERDGLLGSGAEHVGGGAGVGWQEGRDQVGDLAS
jgi:hypothetical protein